MRGDAVDDDNDKAALTTDNGQRKAIRGKMKVERVSLVSS